MECFRIDESGYTGFDLLNPQQRFQGASAIAIDDGEAAKLIASHFPRLKASELKYRALARRQTNHPRLLGLLRDLHSQYKCVTYVCDKRYLLSLFFVDYAVEPYYFERGIDLYVDGRTYGMASLLHTVGPTLFGESGYDELLRAFQLAVKHKTPSSKIRLISAARNVDWEKLPEILGPLAKYACPDCWAAISSSGVTTDAAMVVLQSLISRMEVLANGPYRVEHDQSKNLLTYHPLIQKFIDHKEDIEFRPTEIATWKFPLKLSQVDQVDSKLSPAVQLADVMVGAALEMASNMTGGDAGGLNPTDVLNLYGDGQIIHMLPSIEFEEQKRFRRGSQSSQMIDYFARVFNE
ncbi:DUF3800 domain-containing protein [Brucella tritici]|uniref:DUF3800 domain-containing protein n=1 Tax=Brucella tritici TaxID=94626 RepID=A0A6L3YNA1_9HYPH|nr:DUF3800 domain-containing protein [Brucella tritici]KAB2684400.1 hypothetical protein F9L08_14010 [Brucella tritici]